MFNFNFSEKGLGLDYPPHFVYDCRVAYYLLAKFHCLIAFTYRDIGQYAYYNCLLTRL